MSRVSRKKGKNSRYIGADTRHPSFFAMHYGAMPILYVTMPEIRET